MNLCDDGCHVSGRRLARQVLTRDNIEAIIKFAHKHKLFVFADEVYQENVYADGSKFFSFKKVPYTSHYVLPSLSLTNK